MRTLRVSVFLFAFSLLLQLPLLFELNLVSAASPEVSFYRAIRSTELGTTDPAGYDRVVPPAGSESREVFVERKPTVTFKGKDFRSVVGHRTETNEELNRMVEESFRKRGLQVPQAKEDYTLSITFTEEAGARFRDFTKQHDREMFDLRLAGERLNTGRLYGPFPGNVFSTSGLSKDMLLRLKTKYPGLIELWIK